ncbi:ankyrin [Stipitochalara longipes BDJ]|nr:ankyrin [Stipitochalara longipes BDJ]
MSGSNFERHSDHVPVYEESQAPPYVSHQDGPPSDEIESLPIYTEQHDPSAPIAIQELNHILRNPQRAKQNDVSIWRRYIEGLGGKQTDEDRVFAGRCIIKHYFMAIAAGQADVVSLLIENHLVTVSTKMLGMTPLLMAVSEKNVRVVQLLLELGAEPDEFGNAAKHFSWQYFERWRPMNEPVIDASSFRTPLQLAASIGHLVLVKLLMEQYHCNDSLIAPDGQIALRLAAENGHREVVDYLPSRRGGGFRRWKHKNKTAIRRAKRAAVGIGNFVQFFVWDMGKFFLWTVPKNLIVQPLMKASTWCWKHRREFGPWCVYQLRETPRRMVKFIKWIGTAIRETGKWLWRVIQRIPEAIKDISVWVWKLVAVRLPKAVALLGRWMVTGLSSVAKVVWNAILRTVSFLSTIVTAIASFFRSLTLKDVWNGFCDMLRAVVVALPKLIWSWIRSFGDASYRMMKIILGELGEILWIIGYGILWVVTFIPKKLWIMFQSLGSVAAKAGYEVRVWFDPKAR